MDFDQLRTFIEVARLGSFSRAAEKVLRSQPAVSSQIRQLEQDYGQKLFDRSAKSIRKLMEKHQRSFHENLNITMELTSVVMIKRFVRDGFGVSLVCAAFARENVRRGDVRLLKVDGLDLWRELALVYRKDRSLPMKASAFVQLARKELALGAPPTEV
jgi:DNA-binding transcriptional LysR family regulator